MAKDTCETSRALSISWLGKHGYLEGGWRRGGITWTSGWGDKSSIGFTVDTMDPPHVQFSYTRTTSGEEKESMDYKVRLATTPCQFGGVRYWFICPLVVAGTACHRRVGVLYLAGKYMGCRRCYDLAYQSQQESRRYRALGKFLGFSEEIDKKERELRVRFWKGRPTKRYSRLIRRMEAMNQSSHQALAEMKRMEDRASKGSRKRR